MKIVVFGLGYVGATASASLLKDGHRIVGIDVSSGKAAKIGAGQSPVFEPGLEELLSAGRADGRLGAATEVGGHLDDADIAMVCVGTPSMVGGGLDLTQVGAGMQNKLIEFMAMQKAVVATSVANEGIRVTPDIIW